MSAKTRWVLLFLLLWGLVVGIWWVQREDRKTLIILESRNPKTQQSEVRIGNTVLKVEIRKTGNERALGLSYRESLGENEGMLFIFPTADVHSFWMKDMNFDLDIIWIRDGVVVDISENVPAPKNNGGQVATVSPKEAADWVLEVNGGWVGSTSLIVGERVELIESL